MAHNQYGQSLYGQNSQDSEPLPSGWEMMIDKQTGWPFFVDHQTQQTTWQDPRKSKSQQPSNQRVREIPVFHENSGRDSPRMATDPPGFRTGTPPRTDSPNQSGIFQIPIQHESMRTSPQQNRGGTPTRQSLPMHMQQEGRNSPIFRSGSPSSTQQWAQQHGFPSFGSGFGSGFASEPLWTRDIPIMRDFDDRDGGGFSMEPPRMEPPRMEPPRSQGMGIPIMREREGFGGMRGSPRMGGFTHSPSSNNNNNHYHQQAPPQHQAQPAPGPTRMQSYEAPPPQPTARMQSYEAPPPQPTARMQSYEAPPSQPTARMQSYEAPPPPQPTARMQSYEAPPHQPTARMQSYEAPPHQPTARMQSYEAPPPAQPTARMQSYEAPPPPTTMHQNQHEPQYQPSAPMPNQYSKEHGQAPANTMKYQAPPTTTAAQPTPPPQSEPIPAPAPPAPAPAASPIVDQLKVEERTANRRSPSPAPPNVGPLEHIGMISEEAKNLRLKVDTFPGIKKDKSYLYLEEMLTRLLIKLDRIESNGQDEIRKARKEGVRLVQGTLDQLELKAMSNETTMPSNNSGASGNQGVQKQTANGGQNTSHVTEMVLDSEVSC